MITGLDHLVLTVASLERTIRFYRDILGFEHREFEDRHALHFAGQKLNLHEVGSEFEPRAALAKPGTADLCFLVEHLEDIQNRLAEGGVAIIEGPVARTGARGAMMSVYIRDPDGNLLEFAEYD
jgi:catechol 2,3-dioxygenase-like lactoylglutathione lyase family enzyme